MPVRRGLPLLGAPKTSVASEGPVPVIAARRVLPNLPPLPPPGSGSSQHPQYPPEDSTLQQTTTTTPNGGTVTLVNTQPGNGSDILISASESANIVSIHLINGKTLRIVWENAGPALPPPPPPPLPQ
ncbi:hypothetical protein TWF730_006553 [Orbilia blumenaviensis]|uniref:Uncharacterized protein n=1 Tax=Orbilia blumenaviensis TaxID=1796055 RepID=A0AAV9VHL6_9PEZI